MLPITKIEDALIKQIASAKLPYLRFIGSYGGEEPLEALGVGAASPQAVDHRGHHRFV